MSKTDTISEERLTAIDHGDTPVAAALERPGSSGSGRSGRLLLLSAALIMVAIATMSPIAWVPSVIVLYAWIRSS